MNIVPGRYQQHPLLQQPSQNAQEYNDPQCYSDWPFDSSISSLASTIYDAVHIADNLTDLEDGNSFNVEMTQGTESDCQNCLDKDAEIRELRERVDELQCLGNLCH